MGDDARPKGPFVLNIRMSGRLVPFAAGLTVFAVLPFLGGSTPDPARADVVLAAGSPAEVAVQDAVGVVDAARQGLAGQGTGALLGDAVAVGGGNAAFTGTAGLFMFPSIGLGPVSALTTALTTAAAVAPPITGGHRHSRIHPPGPRRRGLPVRSTHPPRARPGDVPHRRRPHGGLWHAHRRCRGRQSHLCPRVQLLGSADHHRAHLGDQDGIRAPVEVPRRGRRHRQAGSGHRPRGHDGLVDRLSPALRRHHQRALRRPGPLPRLRALHGRQHPVCRRPPPRARPGRSRGPHSRRR